MQVPQVPEVQLVGKVMPQVKGRFDGAAVRPLVQAALA